MRPEVAVERLSSMRGFLRSLGTVLAIALTILIAVTLGTFLLV